MDLVREYALSLPLTVIVELFRHSQQGSWSFSSLVKSNGEDAHAVQYAARTSVPHGVYALSAPVLPPTADHALGWATYGTGAGRSFVVVLVFRLEHFVSEVEVIICTCEKMVLSAIWNGVRHLIVKDDLLAGLVTLRRAACHVGCHSKLTLP